LLRGALPVARGDELLHVGVEPVRLGDPPERLGDVLARCGLDLASFAPNSSARWLNSSVAAWVRR